MAHGKETAEDKSLREQRNAATHGHAGRALQKITGKSGSTLGTEQFTKKPFAPSGRGLRGAFRRDDERQARERAVRKSPAKKKDSPTMKALRKSQGGAVTPGNPEHKRLLKIREKDVERQKENRRAFSAGPGTKS